MRKSKVLAKLRAGQPARLAMMGHFVPGFVAQAAKLGYDGIWVDLEHRNFDPREVQALLAFFHLYDLDAVIRPATREKAQLYRYLEDGAAGFIIPHVNDVESAQALATAVKFPPLGDRGLEGRGLETNFGVDIPQARDPLVAHALEETFLVIQIETPQALAAAEAMAALPGIDGLYVGPSDLGIRLKLLPEAERITVEQAIERVGAICKAHGKLWGSLPRNAEEVAIHAALGANLMVWGIDGRIMEAGLAAAAAELARALP